MGICQDPGEEKKPIQRNVILALGHYKEASAENDLIALMKNDPRPVIRGTAAWSLGKIGTDAAKEALSKALEKEDNEQVQYEMQNALSAMNIK